MKFNNHKLKVMNEIYNHKILIVDDLKANLFALSALLKNAKFDCDSALSGNEALKLLLKNDYGLIILDVQMPDMSGFDLAELIKGNSKTEDTPIIFLSAIAIQRGFFTQGYKLGALDYLTKPVNEGHFMLKVTNFMELYCSRLKLKESLEKEKMMSEFKSRFVSDVSHQFRTPMTVIKSSMAIVSMISETFDEAAKKKMSTSKTRVDNAINQMTNLMDDLLTYSKTESGNIQLKPEKIDLSHFCKEICKTFNEVEVAKEIIFLEHGEQKIVVTDVQLLLNCISNLVSNALKYSPKNENPKLVVHYYPDTFTVSVIDRGIGIPEKELKELFQPFFRSSNVNDIEGTGLGLSIAKSYINDLGGDIKVESKLDEGSSFIITLNYTLNS
ncbi:MAG: signal transduction histidine kinase [Salibacteraceae bacterium]|jgi:signal transduction histidine kinase